LAFVLISDYGGPGSWRVIPWNGETRNGGPYEELLHGRRKKRVLVKIIGE
jgi:hypothetical protein